ncbi:MAG: hypothetical protein M1816_004357 [Peltula sp. TS41687]|nr:MAG: hypothetical protein M1816_004357 [Peltula sp. TS41687]
MDSATTNVHDHHAALDRTLNLLKALDDTSRFVGLALLKSLLDNHEELRNDIEAVSKCWTAVPLPFLQRLLKAPKSKQKNTEEITNMVDLAVFVIYNFALLIPTTVLEEDGLIEMTQELVYALRYSSPEARIQILRILVSLAVGRKGSRALLETAHLSALIEIAPSEPLALEALRYTLLNATAHLELDHPLQDKFDIILSGLVIRSEGLDAKQLFELITDLLPGMPLSDIRSAESPWLPALANMIRANIMSRPSSIRRTATLLASALSQAFPLTFPPLLFHHKPLSKTSETKPFLYLFVNLMSIDLRSTFPSLLELLASPEYPDISQRLAADFKILSTFISFLAAMFDEEEDQNTLPLPPDLLLKLRRELGETASLTVEYLRDRWDGAVSGAAGLHPSIRPIPGKPESKDTPLALPWDDKSGGVAKDPLTLAAIQYLALWLREDDGEILRREAAGILDVLLGLYDAHDGEQAHQRYDSLEYKSPVLLALQGVLDTEDGMDAFLREDGWAVLSKDLITIIHQISAGNADTHAGELIRAVQIVDILDSVQEHKAGDEIREEWMELVKMAASLPVPSEHEFDMQLDFRVSLYQLATALSTQASVRIRARYTTHIAAIVRSCRLLLEMRGAMPLNTDNEEVTRTVLKSLTRLGIK